MLRMRRIVRNTGKMRMMLMVIIKKITVAVMMEVLKFDDKDKDVDDDNCVDDDDYTAPMTMLNNIFKRHRWWLLAAK